MGGGYRISQRIITMSSTALRISSNLRAHLQDPSDGTGLAGCDEVQMCFAGGSSYVVHQGVPLLIDERNSVFAVADILHDKPTTQDTNYRSRNHLKNYLRQSWLPALSADKHSTERYAHLAQQVRGGRVLIIGAGDKGGFYRECFTGAEVVLSDVHLQFGVDLVIDAHAIPFQAGTFALVFAAQVLEHTAQPWRVAAEMQRVAQDGGLVHIEVPFVFPFHAAPYDFYRFTPTALRFLFAESEMLALEAVEGAWSGAAVATAQALVNTFSNKHLRRVALATGRLSLWWMKYLDRPGRRHSCSMPKGVAATYRKDGNRRNEREMLSEASRYF